MLPQDADRVQEDEHLQQEMAPEGRVAQLQLQQAAAAQVFYGGWPIACISNSARRGEDFEFFTVPI